MKKRVEVKKEGDAGREKKEEVSIKLSGEVLEAVLKERAKREAQEKRVISVKEVVEMLILEGVE